MSLDFICKLYASMGIPVNSLIKRQKIVFTPDQFLEKIKSIPPKSFIFWDDTPFWMYKRPIETWGLFGWYLFQKWGFME